MCGEIVDYKRFLSGATKFTTFTWDFWRLGSVHYVH